MAMKKLPVSLVAASVSVISAQAAADQTIKVDQSKVVNDNVDDMKKVFHQSDSSAIVDENLYDIARKITVDDKPIVSADEDVSELIAYRKKTDSRHYKSPSWSRVENSSGCYSNCHSACHGACHGSRGWR